MNKEECKNQIESLIEAWKLEEADLNQTDINAMEEMIALIDKLKSNWKVLKEDVESAIEEVKLNGYTVIPTVADESDYTCYGGYCAYDYVLSKINELEGDK